MNDILNCWLNGFEEEIAALLSRWYSRWEFNPVSPQNARDRFYGANPTMKDAMWTLAHFRYPHRHLYSVEQAAALWFHECCLPILQKDKKNEHERLPSERVCA